MADAEAGRWGRISPAGLSERLLLLTAGFVMLAEILIYVPSIAAFRNSWLSDRLAAARTAALIIESSPPDMVPETTIQELLRNLQAKTVTIKIDNARRLLALSDMPEMIDRQFDLREPSMLTSIAESFDTLLFGGNRTINVVGPAPMGADFIDIVVDEAPLRTAMLRYSTNILLVSLLVSGITALLLYLALLRVIVRPMSRLVASIMAFAQMPEDARGIIEISGRRDEIGRAEVALHGMQTTLAQQLKQKKRLARLGLAVSKINHDLRNMLASVQLFSDRLASLPDPTVQRLAPKLILALDRAISFCQSTLAFGKAQEAVPQARLLPLEPLLEDVREMLGAGEDGAAGVVWQSDVAPGFEVYADPDQLYRILVNLGRNAIEALRQVETRPGWRPTITLSAAGCDGMTEIEVGDNGPGVPPSRRATLFEAFAGSGRQGSTGLGLAIASDLAQAHGGSIRLMEDGHGPGATFRVQLPQPG